MKITKQIYQSLLEMPNAPPETGGIIGGRDRTISAFIFDNGIASENYDSYIPNIQYLNKCLHNWKESGIELYGIVHTHRPDATELSCGDKNYIEKIMAAFKVVQKEMLFPIIIPNMTIIWYKAVNTNFDIDILKQKVDVL